jgi:DNA-binding transcriptional LysR family regulator
LLAETLAQHGLPLTVGIEVGTLESLKQYVARGLGIAVVAGLGISEADRARLEIVPIPPELGGKTTYGVVVRNGKHRSRLLIDLLRLLGA